MKFNMLRHIHETPDALRKTLAQALPRIDAVCERLRKQAPESLIITGCGASLHAALAARVSFETLLNVPVTAAPASELALYPQAFFTNKRMLLAISRSGEKGDILAAVRTARKAAAPVLAVTATADSLLAKAADEVILTREGPEYCQPKTKSFVAVLGALNAIAIHLVQSAQQRRALLDQLRQMPDVIQTVIRTSEKMVAPMARELKDFKHIYLTGTLANLGAAQEAALKLKETSCIHAEAFPTGEMAQGPLLLLNPSAAYIPFITRGGRDLAVRIVKAAYRQGAKVIALTEEAGDLSGATHHTIVIPPLPNELFAPMAYIIPIQLLACHLGVEKGLDCDNPAGFDVILELILEPGRQEPEMRIS